MDLGGYMTQRSSLRRVLAVLVVAMLFFAACSSDDDDDAGGTGDTSSGSPSDPTAVLTVGSDLQQSTGAIPLNPLLNQAGGAPQDPLYFLIYGRLMRPMLDGSIEPDLAESVDLVNATTITINLREGLTFSDGTPLDADAVAAYYQTVLDNKDTEVFPGVTLVQSYQEPFFALSEVTVDDPTTVTLTIGNGTAAGWYDQHVSTWTASIVKVPVVDDLKPIGAGPFKVDNFQPGSSVTLSKNDSYWRADDVQFAGVNVQTVAFSQPASGLAGVQSGQLDWVFTDATQLGAVSGDVEVLSQTSPNKGVWLHWCKSGPPLEDPRVRVAINKAFDRDAISDAVYGGTASPSVQMWPNDHRLANPDLNETLAYDPEGARQLLQEAGFGGGLALDMYPIQVFGLPDVAQIVQQQLADVGITVTIVPTTDYVNQYLQNPASNAIGMYPANAAGLAKLNGYTGSGLGNVCKYSDPDLDAVINELQTVSESSDEAQELWHEAADFIVSDALSGFILFRSDLMLYNSARLSDAQPLGGSGDFKLPDPFVTYVKSGS
jgi:peptide/nickel transport system substrate-binding protein